MQTEQSANQIAILKSGDDAHCAWVEVVTRGTKITVSPPLAQLLLQNYPNLALHACKGGADSAGSPGTFGEHLAGALLPHALEHLTIEYLVKAVPGEIFTGATKWASRNEQIMRVKVSLPKNGSASQVQQAFADALTALNALLAMCQTQTRKETLS